MSEPTPGIIPSRVPAISPKASFLCLRLYAFLPDLDLFKETFLLAIHNHLTPLTLGITAGQAVVTAFLVNEHIAALGALTD